MNLFKKTVISGAVLLGMGGLGTAHAGLTSVQFSTDGSGTYDVVSIEEFDWQSSSNTVIEQTLVNSSTGATTLTDFFSGPLTAGDTFTINLHYQANLVDMVGSTPNPVSNLDADGAANGDAGFEVTVVGSAVETGVVVGVYGNTVVVGWTSINGSYSFYWDDTPDMDHATGSGFADGVEILTGSMTSISGTFSGPTGLLANPGGQGSAFIQMTIDSYDSQYIEADPISGAPLVGSTFDALLDMSFGNASNMSIQDGGIIGAAGYVVQADDIRLSTDGKTQFAVPEPSTLFLMGSGFLAMGAFGRRRRQAKR